LFIIIRPFRLLSSATTCCTVAVAMDCPGCKHYMTFPVFLLCQLLRDLYRTSRAPIELGNQEIPQDVS
jgi:hypothetical protein